MVLGHVRDYMPRVSLMLPGVSGPVSVEFILDTGFDGELALPPSLLPQLDAAFFRERRLQVADGRIITRIAYVIDLEWNEELRQTEIMVLENAPLLGAILLDLSHVDLDMRSGSEVLVEPD